MATERAEAGSRRLPRLRDLRNPLGVGLHLLLLGLRLEGLTIVTRRWISWPIALRLEMRVLLTALCAAACLAGMIWFSRSLSLTKRYLRSGKSALVTHGPFAHVRHPLYATLLMTIPPLAIVWFSDFLFLIPWVLIFVVSHCVVSFEERGLIE